MMRTLLSMLLLAAPVGAHALTVPEALSAATGWPLPGRDGTWRADDLRGKVPGGFHHGSGLGYVLHDPPPLHDEHSTLAGEPTKQPHDPPKPPHCPPAVPIPAAIWLFASSMAGMALFGRRP